jgi:glyoxylase-like metal-dependent hydrolase (beta-lactamase superfamily II)
MLGAPARSKNRRDEIVGLGSLRIANRDTPGHAEDGVTYVITGWPGGAPPVAVVGDAIFSGSMGGAKAHGSLAKAKVREQILSLPDDTLICPGHGPLTTVGQEKVNNPFF